MVEGGDTVDDEKIIELFFARSEDALTELDKKYGALMRRVSKNVLKDDEDVKECVNDAYLGIWRAIPPERPSPLSAYVCRVIRNISLNRHRKNTALQRDGRKNVSLEEIADFLPDDSDVFEKVAGSELTDILNRYLSTLERTNLYIFMRKYWYFDNVSDIASRLGMTEAAVYLRLDRMKKSLYKYLVKQGVMK